MCCNGVICANCSRPVAETACPVCRAAHADLHGQPMSLTAFVVAFAALLLLGFVLAAHV